MSWRDALVLAWLSLRRRPGRTALTVIGVMLGSSLLVALGTISGTADTQVVNKLGRGGPAAAIKVSAAAPVPGQLDSDNPGQGRPKDLQESTLDTIRHAPYVASVVPVLSAGVLVVPPPLGLAAVAPGSAHPAPQWFTETMVGADLRQWRNLPVTLLAGRLPAADSLTEVAVTQGYLDRLHLDVTKPEAVLGTEVEFAAPQVQESGSVRYRGRWFRARVVGVVAQEVGNGLFLVPLQQTQLARHWALGGVGDGDFKLPTSPYTALVVVAASLDQVHTVRAEVALLGYATSAPEHLVASVQKYLRVVDIVLGGIGAVALAIATLGVANSLLTAVRERRREIGVLKAIGARDRDVLRWFLLEAGLIGGVGGVLGTAAGLGVAELVGMSVNSYLLQQGLDSVSLTGFSAPVLLGGVLGSAALSLVAGVIPALAAARLSPRNAMVGG